jgi:hypothetical protein
VRAEMEKQHIPGLALLVSRNGAPIREQGFGLANLELHVPATPKTIFQSGSVGKQPHYCHPDESGQLQSAIDCGRSGGALLGEGGLAVIRLSLLVA